MRFRVVDITRIEKAGTYVDSSCREEKSQNEGLPTERCSVFYCVFAVGMQKIVFIEDQVEILDGLSKKEGFHAIVETVIFDVLQLNIEMGNTSQSHSNEESTVHVPMCIRRWFYSRIQSLQIYPRR